MSNRAKWRTYEVAALEGNRKRPKSLASSGSFDILAAGALLVRRGIKWKKGAEIGGYPASLDTP